MSIYIEVEKNLIQDLLNTQNRILDLLQKKEAENSNSLLTVKEAEKFLNVSEAFLRQRIADGRLKVIRVGNGVRIEKNELFNLEKK